MPAQWTGEIVGKLHANRIQHAELASQLGLTPEYVSMVLNGKRKPKNAETKFNAALAELIKVKKENAAYEK